MKKPGAMLSEVLKHIFKKPATLDYPAKKVEMPADFRGKLLFQAEKCVGCKMCMRDCPAEAIIINKLGEKLYECVLDMDRCIFCSQCVLSCNPEALSATPDFELAQLDKGKLSLIINEKEITEEMKQEALRLAREKALAKEKALAEAKAQAAAKAQAEKSEPPKES